MTPRILPSLCGALLIMLPAARLSAQDSAALPAASSPAAEASQNPGPDSDTFVDDHAREELGVNVFTAPSIARLLRDLEQLRPIPYSKIRRPIPDKVSSDRATMALTMGALIAQGFALVDAENLSDLETLARSLLRHARGLSILDAVLPRASSLLELGSAGKWSDLRAELSAAQADAEQAMIELRDEEIAHLVSAGGWLRGLEIVSAAILENYTPERAEFLRKPELLDYFLDRLSTLHPDIARRKVIRAAIAESGRIRLIIEKPGPLTRDDVAEINARARAVIDTLLGPRRAN